MLIINIIFWLILRYIFIEGQRGWEEAEIHDSNKMSTLILKYTREHHMGKYTLVAQNQLGAAECTCDLIVRKKQFPPVFWQRLYNVNGDDTSRFVGEVEVGGWPVPDVYWYKVMEDGEEVEVTTKTHTENWNGNPNKYVPESRVEVRQLDQIRHVIIFHQASQGESGLYRVRAINALGEAECEADLYFDGEGCKGDNLYLPPLWKEKKRMTWKDEDQRKKPYVGFNEPEMSPEELDELRKKSGGVPLNRIMEYLASLPDYVPSDNFKHMDRMPFKAGVDEHDYRPNKKGGKCSYPVVFKKGKFEHHGYKSDIIGRILPVWQNEKDPKSRDSSKYKWIPVHPDLFVPEIPARIKSPDAPPIWESDEDIKLLAAFMNSMGSRVHNAIEISQPAPIRKRQREEQLRNNINIKETRSFQEQQEEQHQKSQISASSSKIEKFSYIRPNENRDAGHIDFSHQQKGETTWEERLNANTVGSQSNAEDFTAQFLSNMYQKEDNISYPELDINEGHDRPALPPKTKIMNSPSRNIFSPTESIENNVVGSASVKTVEFLPVKEKVKLIAAQQEELNRKEEMSSTPGNKRKNKGVKIMPPSPVTVRKMSVDDGLFDYDDVVTRSTPVTQVLEKSKTVNTVQQDEYTKPAATNIMKFVDNDPDYSSLDSGFAQSSSHFEAKTQSQNSFQSQVQTIFHQEHRATQQHSTEIKTQDRSAENKIMKQEQLERSAADKEVGKALDQLIAERESVTSADSMFTANSKVQQYQAYSTNTQSSFFNVSSTVTSSNQVMQPTQVFESSAEECRRSFEEAELEALALESQTSKSFSKQSSIAESTSVQSFVLQNKDEIEKSYAEKRNVSPKESSASEVNFRSRKPVKSNSFVGTPKTSLASKSAVSAPNTPMSQKRRLRINQSPKPIDTEDSKLKYRDSPSAPFQPGFYRAPPEDSERAHIFQLTRRSSSKTRMANNTQNSSEIGDGQLRSSQASSRAYEGDYESEAEK